MSKNIMGEKQASLTDRGLDKFSQFLENELSKVTNLAPQIPDKAYIFHGSYDDPELTQAEIKRATDLLVRMELGVADESPVIIVFEYATDPINRKTPKFTPPHPIFAPLCQLTLT